MFDTIVAVAGLIVAGTVLAMKGWSRDRISVADAVIIGGMALLVFCLSLVVLFGPVAR